MQALTVAPPPAGGFDLGANSASPNGRGSIGHPSMVSATPKSRVPQTTSAGPVSSNGQFVVIVENGSGVVSYCGAGAREIIGVSVGSSLLELIHPEDVSTFLSTLAAIVASGPQIQIVYRIRTPDGQYRLYEAVCRPTAPEYASVANGGGVTVVSTPVSSQREQQHGAPQQQGSQQRDYIAAAVSAASHPQPQTAVASAPASGSSAANTTLWARRRMQQHEQFTSPPLSVMTSSANEAYGDALVTPSMPTSASSLSYSGASTMSYNMMPPYSAPPPAEEDAVYMENMWTPVMAGYPAGALAAKYPYGAGQDWLTNSSSEDMGDDGPRSPVAIAPPTYWDNVTNSELVSPQFYYQHAPYGPGGQYYMDYQTPTMEFSPGYSVPTKKSPSVGHKSTSRRKAKHSPDGVDGVPSYMCTECGAVESPEWRKGPQGPKTLCNACGLRWAKRTRKEEGSSISPPGRKR